MIERRTWKEFRESKLLWWANRLLQTFGWSLVCSMDDNGDIVDVYPARVKFRGYGEDVDNEGFIGLMDYVVIHAKEINLDITESGQDNLVMGTEEIKEEL